MNDLLLSLLHNSSLNVVNLLFKLSNYRSWCSVTQKFLKLLFNTLLTNAIKIFYVKSLININAYEQYYSS